MKTHTLTANLHCQRCVDQLATVLNKDPRIHHWSADVQGPEKTITLRGQLDLATATSLVEQAGFVVNAPAAENCSMEAVEPSKPMGFWKDAVVWKRASFNTFNCLVGCAIGDFGMVIYLQTQHPGTAMWLQMVLAIAAGLLSSIALETALLHHREKFAWRAALRLALSMSLLSMVAMEVAMNTTDFLLTGGRAELASARYWLAFLPAAVAGFLTPLPYNYYQLKKHHKACHENPAP